MAGRKIGAHEPQLATPVVARRQWRKRGKVGEPWSSQNRVIALVLLGLGVSLLVGFWVVDMHGHRVISGMPAIVSGDHVVSETREGCESTDPRVVAAFARDCASNREATFWLARLAAALLCGLTCVAVGGALLLLQPRRLHPVCIGAVATAASALFMVLNQQAIGSGENVVRSFVAPLWFAAIAFAAGGVILLTRRLRTSLGPGLVAAAVLGPAVAALVTR